MPWGIRNRRVTTTDLDRKQLGIRNRLTLPEFAVTDATVIAVETTTVSTPGTAHPGTAHQVLSNRKAITPSACVNKRLARSRKKTDRNKVQLESTRNSGVPPPTPCATKTKQNTPKPPNPSIQTNVHVIASTNADQDMDLIVTNSGDTKLSAYSSTEFWSVV